jgi:hypothetical protein
MNAVRLKILFVCVVVVLLGGMLVSPAEAVTVLYQRPGVNPGVSIYLGEPFNNLEFENPPPPPGGFVIGKHVKGYSVLDWRDADYSKLGYPLYGDWARCGSGVGLVDGCANEVWMRQNGQAISTTTRVSSTAVSIHLTGDNNDGKAEVRVDGILVAILDMGTRGNPQTALIIVKYLPVGTHTIRVDDVGVGPSGLGTDVATMGACALAFHKWFPHFWYLDCRLRLLPTPMDVDHITPIPVVVPNGWWGGWWWWHHQCCWFRPWYGPIWRYQPYYPWPWWRWRLYWGYWPYYKYYYGPWWNYWQWQGGPWFWGFKKCFHYTWRPWWPYYPWPYTYPWRPPIIYLWSWYWDPGSKGNCVEMFTMADEENPAGGRILPVTDNVRYGLDVNDHNFNVNNTIDGNFGSLQWVEIGDANGDQLRSSFAYMTGADANDVNDFMESDIVQELLKNNGGGGGRVGLQYATWTHTDAVPALEVSADSIVMSETGGEGASEYEYTVLPTGTPTVAKVSVIASSARLDLGAGPGEPRILEFNPGNWYDPQTINVMAVDDGYSQGTEILMIGHTISTDPNTGISVQVTLQDNEVGGWGFAEGDITMDGKVNFYDMAVIANDWLSCTDPVQP